MGLNYKTRECLVAFIDILGSSDAIMKNAQQSLNIVHRAYDETMKIYNDLFSNEKIESNIKIFSDNIVISVPYKKDGIKSSFLTIAILCSLVQVQLLKYGWLTRGGISTGSYFVDDIMVWGTALVKAYILENSVAIYPRIIIDMDLAVKLNLSNLNNMFIFRTWIRQDEDRLFFVEYLNSPLKDIWYSAKERIDETVMQVKTSTNGLKKYQKWLWLSRYFEVRMLESMANGDENTNA